MRPSRQKQESALSSCLEKGKQPKGRAGIGAGLGQGVRWGSSSLVHHTCHRWAVTAESTRRIGIINDETEVASLWIVLRTCLLPFSPSWSFHLSLSCLCLPAVPHPNRCALLDFCILSLTLHTSTTTWSSRCAAVSPPASLSCALLPALPALHLCNVSCVSCVVPSVSEESPSASESGVLLSQDPSAKPVLLLPPKKPAAFSGDHEETPVKQLSLLKQPPALPPKPTARIANHLTGESRRLWGPAALPSLQGIISSLTFCLKPDAPP